MQHRERHFWISQAEQKQTVSFSYKCIKPIFTRWSGKWEYFTLATALDNIRMTTQIKVKLLSCCCNHRRFLHRTAFLIVKNTIRGKIVFGKADDCSSLRLFSPKTWVWPYISLFSAENCYFTQVGAKQALTSVWWICQFFSSYSIILGFAIL